MPALNDKTDGGPQAIKSCYRMKPTILIVDDHHLVRSAMHNWLAALFADHVFHEATSGEEAVEIAASQQPAVVVMDVGLPKMSGIEAARIIRKSSPRSRVVMLSIHEAIQFREDAASAGASAYVPKRKMATDLVPVLQRLLAEWHGERDDAAVI